MKQTAILMAALSFISPQACGGASDAADGGETDAPSDVSDTSLDSASPETATSTADTAPDATDATDTAPDAADATDTAETTQAPPAVIYATFITHNEQDSNAPCHALYADSARVLENRALTLTLAQTIADGGGTWDLETDYRYLELLASLETDALKSSTTEGKQAFRYLADHYPGVVTIEPHNHPTPTVNFADVAAMLTDLGIADSQVVGGFLWYPAANADWTVFQNGSQAALSHPGASWRGRILWGPGTVNHLGPDSFATGVWHPKSADEFHVHDPNGTMTVVGRYEGAKGSGSGIEDLLGRLARGELESGRMYTAAIFFDQCILTTADIDYVRTFLASHAADVAAGRLVWASLPKTVQDWQSHFGGEGFLWNLPDASTAECTPACTGQQVCCPVGRPCAGTCVPDCRTAGCPQPALTCDAQTGFCQ